VVLAAVVFVWGTYALLWFGGHENAWGRWLRSKTPKTHFGHTNWWLALQKGLDAPENCPKTQMNDTLKSDNAHKFENE